MLGMNLFFYRGNILKYRQILQIIATMVRFPNQQENQGQPYLFQGTLQKVCSSYQAYHC